MTEEPNIVGQSGNDGHKALADRWEKIARDQGVFVKREGNRIWVNGTIDMRRVDASAEQE